MIQETRMKHSEVTEIYNYSYDSNRNMVKSIHTFTSLNETYVATYEYNEFGKLIKEVPEEMTQYTRYDYRANGELLKETLVVESGAESVMKEYVYDENGFLIKEMSRIADIEYYYDSNHYLNKIVEMEDGVITATTEYSDYKVFLDGNLFNRKD